MTQRDLLIYSCLASLSCLGAGCGSGASAEDEGGVPEPAIPEPATRATFDPVQGMPDAPPPSTPLTQGQKTRSLEEGATTFVEEVYRDGTKKTRRQVLRTAEGIVNHGPYMRWHKNGVVAEEGEYRNGQRQGKFIERFDTGQPLFEVDYVDGVVHGVKREWSDVGYLKKEAEFQDGLRHGSYRTWTMMNEGVRTVMIEGTHSGGRKTGEWTYYYRTGEKRDHGRFEDSVRQGLWTTWWEEGTLRREAEHLDGEWQGRVAEYGRDGHELSEGGYAAGLPEGVLTTWYPGGGGKKSEKTYHAGRQEGLATTWFEGGQMESRGEMLDGKQHGDWVYWNRDGSVNSDWSGRYEGGERIDG